MLRNSREPFSDLGKVSLDAKRRRLPEAVWASCTIRLKQRIALQDIYFMIPCTDNPENVFHSDIQVVI